MIKTETVIERFQQFMKYNQHPGLIRDETTKNKKLPFLTANKEERLFVAVQHNNNSLQNLAIQENMSFKPMRQLNRRYADGLCKIPF